MAVGEGGRRVDQRLDTHGQPAKKELLREQKALTTGGRGGGEAGEGVRRGRGRGRGRWGGGQTEL